MDIQNFIAEFKKTFVYDMLKDYVTDEKLFDHFVTENGDIVFLKEQTRQMWSMWQAAKAQAVPECVWVGIYDCSVFESSCGHTFELSNDGTLDDNNMKHCCFCGGKIEAQEQKG